MLDVALNPVLLQESRENKAEINQVYMLALSFAQKQLGMTLSQQYRVVNSSPNSSPDELHRRLGFQKLSSAPKQPNTGNAISLSTLTSFDKHFMLNPCSLPTLLSPPKTIFLIIHSPFFFFFFFTAGQTPAALLQHISSLRSENQEDSAPQIIFRPAEKIKKDLIQVISAASVEPQKPEYRLEVKTDAAGVPDSVELTVELPMVCSMSECQLSMSKVSGYTLP